MAESTSPSNTSQRVSNPLEADKQRPSNDESRSTIKTFAATSFLNDMGSDMIYPIWPIFIRSVLGANMTILGILDGLGEAIVSLSQAGSGYLSDRIRKRKVFIWVGYLMGAFSRIGYALSTTWATVFPFRILDRAGKIRSAPRDAIIADISNDNNRGKNFGLLRTADHLGAVVGIIICLLLVNHLSFSTIFALAAIPSLIGVGIILFLIKERAAEKIHAFKGIRLKDLSRNFKLFLIISAIFSLGSFSYSFLLLYAKEFGFAIQTVPILYLIFTVAAALSSYPFGHLADKIGRKNVIAIGFILWIMVCLGFIFSKSFILILFLFVLYGLQKGALETVQKAFVAELSPAEFRASSLGGFQMVIGLCALPASLLAGLLWDNFGKEVPMMVAIGLSIIALLLLGLVKDLQNFILKLILKHFQKKKNTWSYKS
ncbi:MAG: MFS transporter [Bacteroidetes bacterium]|nr:MFS transporter [Bacteroidota bacterium]MBU1423515.1 MFS transporter [Bacteroidota bacterium]MBU2636245.1 MFS transporter [Bacteroidota bacterium]